MMPYFLGIMLLLLAWFQLGWTYPAEPEYVQVKVQAGDTVWHIASDVAEENMDVRDVVSSILKVNHLSGTDDIYPGQVLQVPKWKD